MKRFPLNIFFWIAFVLSIFSIQVFSGEISLPIRIVDDSGVETIISKIPEKIVSTAPSNTEIIFTLGLEKKLVGRSQFCNYPEGVEMIESVGKMFPLNLEKIISLEPDIILSFGMLNPLEDITRLRNLGFKVLVIQPESLQSTIQGINLISMACGIPEKGIETTAFIQQRIEKIRANVEAFLFHQKPKVFVGSNFDTIYSPGNGTLFHELITLAGGENIIGHLTGWVKISPELVTQLAPDIILVPTGIMNQEEISKIEKDIIHHPGWSHVPAIINHRIYHLNEDLFYRAGPRLVDGLELLYEVFYDQK